MTPGMKSLVSQACPGWPSKGTVDLMGLWQVEKGAVEFSDISQEAS